MMNKKRGLGRSLEALLGSSRIISESEEIVIEKNLESELQQLPIEYMIQGRYQPRKAIDNDSLAELAESIKVQGIIQPIIVRPIADKKYEIIAGERRWRAAQLAGLADVPVLVRNIPDEAASAMALIENIQREDLNPLEEAYALKRLIDEFQMTQEEVAQSVGKSRVTITNLLRLLSLNADVKLLLERDDISMGHAKVLLGLEEALQSEAARIVVAKDLSVRETELLIKRLLSPKVPAHIAPPPDPNIRSLEENLSDQLGAKILIQHSLSGKGKLVIHYNSVDELEGILEHIH